MTPMSITWLSLVLLLAAEAGGPAAVGPLRSRTGRDAAPAGSVAETCATLPLSAVPDAPPLEQPPKRQRGWQQPAIQSRGCLDWKARTRLGKEHQHVASRSLTAGVEADWVEGFEMLQSFVDQFGHPHVASRVPRLGRWVREQRVAFQQGQLHPAREALLDSVGFCFDAVLARDLREQSLWLCAKAAGLLPSKNSQQHAGSLVQTPATGSPGTSDAAEHEQCGKTHRDDEDWPVYQNVSFDIDQGKAATMACGKVDEVMSPEGLAGNSTLRALNLKQLARTSGSDLAPTCIQSDQISVPDDLSTTRLTQLHPRGLNQSQAAGDDRKKLYAMTKAQRQQQLAFLVQRMKETEAAVELASRRQEQQMECLNAKVKNAQLLQFKRQNHSLQAAEHAACMLEQARCASKAATAAEMDRVTGQEQVSRSLDDPQPVLDQKRAQLQVATECAQSAVVQFTQLHHAARDAVLLAHEAEEAATAAVEEVALAVKTREEQEERLRVMVGEAEARATKASEDWWQAGLAFRRLDFHPVLSSPSSKVMGLGAPETTRPPVEHSRSVSPHSAQRLQVIGSSVTSEHSSGQPEEREGASGADNAARPKSKTNGVSWSSKKSKWRARLNLPGGVQEHIGYYLREDEAAAAVTNAKEERLCMREKPADTMTRKEDGLDVHKKMATMYRHVGGTRINLADLVLLVNDSGGPGLVTRCRGWKEVGRRLGIKKACKKRGSDVSTQLRKLYHLAETRQSQLALFNHSSASAPSAHILSGKIDLMHRRIGGKRVNLIDVVKLVKQSGGPEAVTARGGWRKLGIQLGVPSTFTDISTRLRTTYHYAVQELRQRHAAGEAADSLTEVDPVTSSDVLECRSMQPGFGFLPGELGSMTPALPLLMPGVSETDIPGARSPWPPPFAQMMMDPCGEGEETNAQADLTRAPVHVPHMQERVLDVPWLPPSPDRHHEVLGTSVFSQWPRLET